MQGAMLTSARVIVSGLCSAWKAAAAESKAAAADTWGAELMRGT
jgi:hypothetical protein